MINSLEEEPTTNAREERFHDTLANCVRAGMVYAGAPLRFWSAAFRHMIHNLARLPDGKPDNKSPYERRYLRASTSVLVPFGCSAIYKDMNAAKFAPRGRRGIVLYPSHHGSFVIMDEEEYKHGHGKIVVTTTRHVKIRTTIFPWLDIEKEKPLHRSWNFSIRAAGAEDLDYRVNTRGQLVCTKAECGKLILFEETDPITCQYCIKNAKHKRGRPGPGCRNSRCQCVRVQKEQEKLGDDLVITTEVPLTPPLARTSPEGSPRSFRLSSKQSSANRAVQSRDRSPESFYSPRQDVAMDDGSVVVAAEVTREADIGAPMMAAAKKMKVTKPTGPKLPVQPHEVDTKKRIYQARTAAREFTNEFLGSEFDKQKR